VITEVLEEVKKSIEKKKLQLQQLNSRLQEDYQSQLKKH
tara:strand:- start:1880 stop:1996 length:117 start_codon:yes stop_codon:yes gene_type:complete